MKRVTFLLLVSLLVACTGNLRKSYNVSKEGARYVVGVSQCNDDAWRRRMNDELQMELVFHPELMLHFRQADACNELQCAQIDSFIAEHVDLIIVCPNEAAEVRPAVERAYDAGIPVVIADRRVAGDKWTAFVGGNNQLVGRLMGEWLESVRERKGAPVRYLEILGLRGSTPAIGRHQGMIKYLGKTDDFVCAGKASGRWYEEPALRVVDSLLNCCGEVDAIVAQNDIMAIAAAKVCQSRGLDIPIMGVDGLDGLQAIVDGAIDATASYPSRGDLVLARAASILKGDHFERETHLDSYLLGEAQARSLLLARQSQNHEIEVVHRLQDKVGELQDTLHLHRIVIIVLILLVLFMVALSVVIWRFFVYRHRAIKIRMEHENVIRRQQEKLAAVTRQLEETKETVSDDVIFMNRLRGVVEKHLDDSELSIEQLASLMGVSRTVLFRKVKVSVGQSPLEFLRHVRLAKAHQLLQKTDLDIQQVAYSVGFSTPSYFTKCYRAEFGVNPFDDSRAHSKKEPEEADKE